MEPIEHEPITHAHHITPAFIYWKTWLILLVLMAATVLAYVVDFARFFPAFGGALNNLVAMAIAITKATLVVLFFMQVKYSSRLVWLWAATGFLWLILIFATLQDYISRHWVYIPGWQ